MLFSFSLHTRAGSTKYYGYGRKVSFSLTGHAWHVEGLVHLKIRSRCHRPLLSSSRLKFLSSLMLVRSDPSGLGPTQESPPPLSSFFGGGAELNIPLPRSDLHPTRSWRTALDTLA